MSFKLAKQLKTKLNSSQSDQGTNRPMVRDSHKLMPVGALIGFAILGATIPAPAHAADYTYSIIYDDNVVSNMPTDVNDGKAVGGGFSLSGNTPKRSGYKFLGWCNTLPSTTDGTDSCSGTTYQPSAGIIIASATNFHFYAMWKDANTFDKAFAAASKTQQSGYYKIQDMSSTICAAVDSGEVGQLIDTRDNEIYYVGKLADNKCWMLDNLRLNPATATLNTSNTHMKSGTTPTYTNTTSSFSSYTAAQFNANYKDNVASEKYGPGSGKVGVYYNFCAASAGTICTSSNSSSASYDICPANWRLPTGGSSGEYQALLTAYNNNKTATDSGSLQYNLSTPLSDFFYNSSQYGLGSYGRFWSSTRYNNTYMYNLYVEAGDMNPASTYDRRYGFSVRCVAQ